MQPDPHERVRPRDSAKCHRTAQVSGSNPAQAGPNLKKSEGKSLTVLLIPAATGRETVAVGSRQEGGNVWSAEATKITVGVVTVSPGGIWRTRTCDHHR